MRDAIAATAMRLFGARGFDAVTMAEVAAAADVSEQTVYNYFPTKAALALSHMPNVEADLLAQLSPDAGRSVVDAFRAHTRRFLRRVAREPEAVLATARLVWQSEALRAALVLGWEEHAQTLARALAERLSARPQDLRPKVLAHVLTWTHRTVVREAHTRLDAGEAPATVARSLAREARRAYDLLAHGLD